MPGRNHGATIAELRQALTNLGIAIGRAASPAVVEALTRQMDEQARTLSSLEAEPAVPAHWVEEPTGDPYREQWSATPDWEARGTLLRRNGVRFYCEGTHRSGTVHMYLPTALRRPAGLSAEGEGAVGYECPDEGARRFFLALRQARGLGPGFWYAR